MDWLAAFVVVAVVGQLCLPLVGAYRNARARAMAKRRADLLEAAADRQEVTYSTMTAKVGSTTQQGQKHV
jgi:Tfp pilus assembly protein PilE